MMAIPHIGFIVAAYVTTALVVGGVIAAVMFDGRSLKRSLERLETRTARDRSAARP